MNIKEIMPNLSPSSFIHDYMEMHGITDHESFLNPLEHDLLENPEDYDNIQLGYELLEKHVSQGGVIGLVLHMDMDSMLSNAITYQYLKDLNPEMEIRVFFPKVKPQGLNKTVVKEILDSDVDLLILTDACSSDIDELKLFHDLNNLGWKHLDSLIAD